jgi:hypothetical protein
MSPMPVASRESASQVKDFGVALDHGEELGGYTVNFLSIRADNDLAPLLAGLPGGLCPCPHWGYLTAGRMTVRYADHEEVIEPGQAYFMAPGHAPAATAGTEFVQFSPTDELEKVQQAMAVVAASMQGQGA